MVIGTGLGWSNHATVVISIVLAFFFGYALTMRPLLRSGLAFARAAKLALAANTISITIMEIVDNALMLVIPGAMDAGLGSALFWISLAFALIVAGAAGGSGELVADRPGARSRGGTRSPRRKEC